MATYNHEKVSPVSAEFSNSNNTNNAHDAQSQHAPTYRSDDQTLAIEQHQPMAPESFIEKVGPDSSQQQSQNAPAQRQGAPIEHVQAPEFVTPLNMLDESPAWIDCPFCHQRTQTRVDHQDSTATTLMGVVCCLICICAACLPCLCGWFQETDHYCSKCNKKVTHKPHDGPVQVMQGQTAHMVPSQYAWNSPQPGQPQSVAVPQQAQVHQDPKQRYEAQMQEHREQQMREQSQPGPQAPPSYSAQQ